MKQCSLLPVNKDFASIRDGIVNELVGIRKVLDEVDIVHIRHLNDLVSEVVREIQYHQIQDSKDMRDALLFQGFARLCRMRSVSKYGRGRPRQVSFDEKRA